MPFFNPALTVMNLIIYLYLSSLFVSFQKLLPKTQEKYMWLSLHKTSIISNSVIPIKLKERKKKNRQKIYLNGFHLSIKRSP